MCFTLLVCFPDQNHAYIILEYIRGGTLMAGMRKAGHLEEDAIAFYSAEMICGLQFLHSKGIIHRDLKPANIMLDQESHIKIVDFGLAKENISGNDTTTRKAGTPRYMAPEVIEEKEYNAAADWWSLGIIIYQMATYTFPFTSPMGKQLSPLTDEPFYPSWLSDELVDLLQALLEKDHHLRLGKNGKIREHPFFRCIDWVKLENRQLTPPFQLAVRSVKNFRDSEGESPFFSRKIFLNKRNRVLEEFSFLDPDLQE
ncbi:protein kinase C delta type-like isoform X1 [Xenopus tropicalis]|uniref:Protein kinase C delta type-like isoform X1 n=4 Tax=Xenopus tropicalis TaxID=8364 RepID=A0A8J1IQ67_XENTR|nr:protein kinase C delta type-like isoform X1 [Xenopus tropicalis]